MASTPAALGALVPEHSFPLFTLQHALPLSRSTSRARYSWNLFPHVCCAPKAGHRLRLLGARGRRHQLRAVLFSALGHRLKSSAATGTRERAPSLPCISLAFRFFSHTSTTHIRNHPDLCRPRHQPAGSSACPHCIPHVICMVPGTLCALHFGPSPLSSRPHSL